jgi:nicotinate-nucleotide adenylyltransferase
MKIGLFFGSFNPIHNGHLIIANYMLEFTDLEQVWFVISPQNPLKKKDSLLADFHRFELVQLALGDSNKYKASNIEFTLPKPSYTIDTLAYLHDKYPKHEFILIMGSDNIVSIEKWKNYKLLLEMYKLYIYPRPGFDSDKYKDNPNIKFINAPLMEISSSFIRDSIKQKKDVCYFMPPKVYDYVKEMHFYEK